MHKRQQRLAYTERRKEVAKLYLEAWTQQAIADHFGVNQSTISRDLEAIRQQWVDSAIKDFNQAFLSRHGSLNCNDLLGCDFSTPEGREQAISQGLHDELCPRLVQSAAEILEEILD